MKRSWTAIAVASAAIFAVTGCNDYGNTFQANTGAFLEFVSPSNVNAGGPDLTITLTGAGFVAQTYVTWDQKKIKTTVTTDPTTGNVLTITAVVPAAMTAKAGTYFVQTQNPFSGAGMNGLSNPVSFVVFPPPNPVPAIMSISPNTAVAGSAALSLTITGSASGANFLPTSDPSGGSQVFWNTTTQTALSVTSITATQIQATVPAAQLATAGTATVTVYNAPVKLQNCTINCTGFGGGGTSNGLPFKITGPGANNASKSAATTVQEETPAVSQDGRYVAYTAAQNGHAQIFARDTCQGADTSCQPSTVLISSALDGTAASDDSHFPSMSSDGRYVAFSSAAVNLVSESTTGRQVYLRDTCFGVTAACTPSTQLISTDPNGTLVGTESILPSVSSSGRFVAFLAVMASQAAPTSAAANKSAASTSNSGYRQVFVRDTCLGAANCTPQTTRISLQPGDGSGTGTTTTKPAGPAISGSADHVALAGGNTATLFRRSVAIDDGIFLALTKNQE
ncbi:MAG: TolB family protein [Candidatus Acidiferrales bacterium]